MAVRVGVDIGGTFTDLVAEVNGQLRWHKLPSTPPDYAEALLAGLAALGVAADEVRHGTTVATNALLERRGARCGLITTAGFRDVLAIGRQNRPDLYALEPRRTEPLIPRELRLEVSERVAADGGVLVPLDEDEVRRVVDDLVAAGVESVAVCLLFGFVTGRHEQRIGAIAREAGLPASLGCEILPEFREFERTSTTVVNAYVSPAMTRYLGSLRERLGAAELRVMQSSGGIIDAGTAGREALRTVLSGPAAGVVGAWQVGRRAGFERLVSLDVGGTSTDVALLDGRLGLTREGVVAGLPISIPMLDIHTVGAGGGSIAWADAGGALAVGPRSAGARPGPAGYGWGGTEPTLTDACLVLGRLPAEAFAGGPIRVDPAAAAAAVDRLAATLGLDRWSCAGGIVRVAVELTARAVRVMTTERGVDPRELALLAFGGAGGLIACELAEAEGIAVVLVPAHAGSLSALGLLQSELIRDSSRTVMRPLAEVTPAQLASWLAGLEAEARPYLAEAPGVVAEPACDLRYRGQSFELTVPAHGGPRDLAERFHQAHERRYGHARRDAAVELVTVRLRLRAPASPPELPPRRAACGGSLIARREVRFGAPVQAEVHRAEALPAGAVVGGPAVLLGSDSTAVVPPGWSAEVDRVGHLVLRRAG